MQAVIKSTIYLNTFNINYFFTYEILIELVKLLCYKHMHHTTNNV